MPGKRSNNDRKFPDANHQPRHMASLRKQDALARQAEYDKLTLEQKIAKLPPEPHSAKQRVRLLTLLDKKNQPKETPALVKGELVVVGGDTSPKTKKHMKGHKNEVV